MGVCCLCSFCQIFFLFRRKTGPFSSLFADIVLHGCSDRPKGPNVPFLRPTMGKTGPSFATFPLFFKDSKERKKEAFKRAFRRERKKTEIQQINL